MSKRARAEVSAAVPPPTQNVASGLAVQSTANGQGVQSRKLALYTIYHVLYYVCCNN